MVPWWWVVAGFGMGVLFAAAVLVTWLALYLREAINP